MTVLLGIFVVAAANYSQQKRHFYTYRIDYIGGIGHRNFDIKQQSLASTGWFLELNKFCDFQTIDIFGF